MPDDDLQLEPLPSGSGRRMDQVVQAIRQAVDDGRMAPGVRYSVYQLAEQLGVSRTPVRDALLRLEDAGAIRFRPRQGFHILLPHPRDIADIVDVRLSLELPAVRRVAAQRTAAVLDDLDRHMRAMESACRRDDEVTFSRHDVGLHDTILDAAGNARARSIVASLRESTRLLGATTADRTRTLTDIDAEHRPVVAAIVAGDPDAAEDALRAHLVSTGRLLMAQAARDQGPTERDSGSPD